MPRVTNHGAESKIAAYEAFHNSSETLWGTQERGEVHAGRLPQDAREHFLKQHNDGVIDYYVMSYSTPIAWVLADGTKVVPQINYSQTTSHHQNIVRRAWGL